MDKMMELTVHIENKPGTLANLGEALAKAKVNVLAFAADEVGGVSRVRLTTDDPAKAKEVLAELNLQAAEAEVLAVVLKNKPGTLAKVAKKIASADININYSYSGAEEGSKKQLVVFALGDVKRAAKALKKS
ncbi:MAG: ACT domain-containing protein [Terriglobia bacterium]